MDFHLTKEQQDIKKAAREFALGEFTDVAREYDINETVPMDIIRKAKELGLVGSYIPEEYGGPGFGFLEWAMIMEEFWRVDPGIGQQLSAVAFGSEEIMLFGTEEQKKKWLPRIFETDAIMGFGITEPDAGSDTASASTTAALEGDEYVINGSKIMISNGNIGEFLLVYCLTDPEAKSKTGRHSIIIVETDREGYEAEPMHGKMGVRASDTASVYFSNVRVPKENLVGTRGNGFLQLMKFFDHSRTYVAGHGVGLAQGALEMAVKHVKARKAFGKTIASFQGTQFKIAEMAAKIETARNTVYKAAWLLDHGKSDPMVTAIAKLYASRIAVEVVDEALQLHGGYGYFDDTDIQRFYRAAKVLEIYEGAKEIEKMVIGREMMGRI